MTTPSSAQRGAGDAPGTDATGGAERPGIAIRGLTLRVAGRDLLVDTGATFPARSVTLVVGPSGTGKSLLLHLLAGLTDTGSDRAVQATGSIRIEGSEVLAERSGARPTTGIIFQNFALFDELTAMENLRFAADHRPRSARAEDPQSDPKLLLEEFGIPGQRSVNSFSGGEKQRLAIARTLAYDPPVLLFDEPTSGLDPANARLVAERIRRTADEHHKTTVVVTHDYANLASIADTVYVLDASALELRRVDSDELANAALAALAPARPDASATAQSVPAFLRRSVGDFFDRTGGALTASVVSACRLVPLWKSLRWGTRYLRHYVGLLASPSAWLYFGAAGVIGGFVSTHFLFKFLPQKKYTEPLFSDEVLNGLGFVLYRVLIPVLLTVLLAARCGAAVASDVGNRLQGQQVAAMRSLGARPQSYLLTPILYAFLLATPFLVGLGFLAARTTSLLVFTYNYPEHGAAFWDVHFHRNLIVPGEFLYRGTYWLLAKVLLSGVGVGAIAYHVAMRPKASTVAVSRDVTATIIRSTLYVLVVHFAFAFFEY